MNTAGVLDGRQLGGREEVEVVPVEGDGDVGVRAQGLDDGRRARRGGWGDEVLIDGEAEGGRDPLVDLD